MTSWLMFAYALVFPFLLGLSFVGLFLNNKEEIHPLERGAFGFLAGLMLLVLEMLLFSRLNIRFSLVALSLPWLPLIVYGLINVWRRQLLVWKPQLNTLTWLEKALIAVILLQFLLVCAATLIKPVVACDAFNIYSWRAKMFFIEQTALVPNAGQTDHPLFNCLDQTWIFISLNNWHEIAGKVVFPVFYACLLTLFYFALRRAQNRTLSLAATLGLASLPFLAYHVSTAYADFPLATYYFAGVSLLFLWFNRPRYRTLALAALFLLSLIVIKSEGTLYLATTFLTFVLTIFTLRSAAFPGLKTIRLACLSLLPVGAGYLGYLVFFSRHNTAALHSLSLNARFELARIPALLAVFGEQLFIRGNWSLLWFGLLLLILFHYRRLGRNFNYSLLLLIALNLGALLGYYFVIDRVIFDMLFVVTPAVRNTLQFAPLAMLLVGYLLEFDLMRGPVLKRKVFVAKITKEHVNKGQTAQGQRRRQP